MFNSVSHVQNELILWVIWEKIKSFESYSILSVILKKNQSLNHIEKGFNSLRHVRKKGSIVRVMFYFKKKFNSLSQIKESSRKRVQFFGSQKKIQFFESHKKGFNSLNHEKEGSILWVIIQKRVQFFESVGEKKFTSLSHIAKKSILWVVQKKVQFLETCKIGPIRWVIWKGSKGMNS